MQRYSLQVEGHAGELKLKATALGTKMLPRLVGQGIKVHKHIPITVTYQNHQWFTALYFGTTAFYEPKEDLLN